MAKAQKIEAPGTIKRVPLGKMHSSPRTQREIKWHRVDHLVASMDLDQIGLPVLSERGGEFYIIDGQHRVEALKKWLGDGWEKQQIECRVYTGLSEAQEAEKFDRLNDVLAVSAFDKFRVRVVAGRTVETSIQSLVESEGLCISKEGVPGAIRAVGTLRRIYNRSDGATLSKALRIIRDAYGDAGFEARVIDGIGHLCQRYNGVLEEKAAIDRLSKAHGGVKGLLGKAEVLHKQTGNAKAHCVAAAAVDIINSRRGGKKLPSWWKA